MVLPRAHDSGASDSLRQQAALYGAPIAAVLDRVGAALGLSQAAVARTIGVSAPMLSQLASGQRVKLGNPLAVQRLRSLLDLAAEAEAGLGADEVARRIAGIAEEESTTLTTRRTDPLPGSVGVAGTAEALHRALTALASRADLVDAAEAVRPHSPALADLLHACGIGTTDDVAAHLAPVRDLL